MITKNGYRKEMPAPFTNGAGTIKNIVFERRLRQPIHRFSRILEVPHSKSKGNLPQNKVLSDLNMKNFLTRCFSSLLFCLL